EISSNTVAEKLEEDLCPSLDPSNFPSEPKKGCIDLETAKSATDFSQFKGKKFCDYETMAKVCKKECSGKSEEIVQQCFADTGVSALSEKIEPCFAYKAVATINFEGDHLDMSESEYTSFDGQYTCKKRDQFTADYKFC